jgi:predicted HTH domain antitoxin
MREALKIDIHELKLRHALDQYRKSKASFGRTSELTGLGYRELYLELKQRNIPHRYGEERLSHP